MSVELERTLDALEQAHAAGNKEDATQLADYARQLQAEAAKVEEQNKAIQSASKEEAQLRNPIAAAGVGAVGGELAGRALNLGMAKTPSAAAQSLGPYFAPGQKYAAKTGYGAGHGETVQEVVDEFKKREGALGKGKATSRLSGAPMHGQAALDYAAAKEAEALRYKALREAERKALERSTSLPGKIGSAMRGATPMSLRVIGGAGAGLQLSDAYNRFKAGDYPGAAIGTVGGLGSAAALIPHPIARVLGSGVGLSAEALNLYRDYQKENPDMPPGETEPIARAHGGLVHLAEGGMPDYGFGAQPQMMMTQSFDPPAERPFDVSMTPQQPMDMFSASAPPAVPVPMMTPQQPMTMFAASAPPAMPVPMMTPSGMGSPNNPPPAVPVPVRAPISQTPQMPGIQMMNPRANIRPHNTPIFRANMPKATLKRPVMRPGLSPRHFAEGGESNTSPFIGFPQINRNRKVGSGTGFLDAAMGAPADPNRTVLNPADSGYLEGYGKGEPYGIAGMALPFMGGPIKALGKTALKELGPKAAGIAENIMVKQGLMPSIVPQNSSLKSTRVGAEFDPRFDSRKGEQDKLKNLITHTERYQNPNIPTVSLPEFEGQPFVTQMADRTNAGHYLQGINDVKFKNNVDLLGGQPYMFNNEGLAWTSTPAASKQTMNHAGMMKELTGKDPLLIPWRMGPTGSDFAHMTGETQLAYAQSAMGNSEKKMLDASMKSYIPDWKGIDNPESMMQFKTLPSKTRKAVQFMIDKDFRDMGGLGIGEARMAIAEPSQVNAPWGGIQNVGRIFADKPIIPKSNHWSYLGGGVPGEGIGTLNAQDQTRNIYEMIPKAAKERNILNPKNPSNNDLRALQMHPYTGIISDKLLKSMGYKKGGEVQNFQVGGLAAILGKALVKHPHGQDARVAKALEEYLKGNISQADRINILNQHLPIRKWDDLPPNYTDEQIKNALTSNKQSKALAPVPAGMQVGNRLDIPAYTQNGVYVDTTHDAGNKAISYGRTGHLSNVDFSSKPNQAVRVGLGTKEQALTPMGAEMGSAKSPFAMIKGTNVGTSDEEVRRMMAEMMKDPKYTQIGMDPRRHSQFYDKSTGMPVFSAEEKLQSGPLIIAPKRGLETTSWDDPRLNLSDFPGKKYKKGGKVKKK